MAKSSSASRVQVSARVIVATIGTLPVALLAAVCLARFLPFEEATRFVLGFTLAIPLWVTLMSVLFLTRSAWRSGLVCGVCAVALWW